MQAASCSLANIKLISLELDFYLQDGSIRGKPKLTSYSQQYTFYSSPDGELEILDSGTECRCMVVVQYNSWK